MVSVRLAGSPMYHGCFTCAHRRSMSILYHLRAILYQAKHVRARTIFPSFAVKALAGLLVFCAVACSDHPTRAGETGGTLVISTTADPGTLFPPLLYMTQGKQIAEQLYDYLADVGPEMNTR